MLDSFQTRQNLTAWTFQATHLRTHARRYRCYARPRAERTPVPPSVCTYQHAPTQRTKQRVRVLSVHTFIMSVASVVARARARIARTVCWSVVGRGIVRIDRFVGGLPTCRPACVGACVSLGICQSTDQQFDRPTVRHVGACVRACIGRGAARSAAGSAGSDERTKGMYEFVRSDRPKSTLTYHALCIVLLSVVRSDSQSVGHSFVVCPSICSRGGSGRVGPFRFRFVRSVWSFLRLLLGRWRKYIVPRPSVDRCRARALFPRGRHARQARRRDEMERTDGMLAGGGGGDRLSRPAD